MRLSYVEVAPMQSEDWASGGFAYCRNVASLQPEPRQILTVSVTGQVSRNKTLCYTRRYERTTRTGLD